MSEEIGGDEIALITPSDDCVFLMADEFILSDIDCCQGRF